MVFKFELGYFLLCSFLLSRPHRIVYLASSADIWVYPFLAKMPPMIMSVFFAGSFFVSLILYYSGMLLSYLRYGSESQSVCVFMPMNVVLANQLGTWVVLTY